MNRKNVIEGLETIKQFFGYGLPSTAEMFDSYNGTLKDALALLKEQEAVEPVVDIDTWKCGNCGYTLEHQKLFGDNVLFHEQYDYCPGCGRKVKWNA